MLWLGLNPESTPRTQILMPPLFWDLQPADAQAIMTALATAIHAGLAVPRPLPALIADVRGGRSPQREESRPSRTSAGASASR